MGGDNLPPPAGWCHKVPRNAHQRPRWGIQPRQHTIIICKMSNGFAKMRNRHDDNVTTTHTATLCGMRHRTRVTGSCPIGLAVATSLEAPCPRQVRAAVFLVEFSRG